MVKGSVQKIPVNDINLSAYLNCRGIKPELIPHGSTGHIAFNFPVSDETYKVVGDYNDNKPVPVLDFVNSLRSLKAQMMALKAGK
ncbi:MAG: DUF5659 domain-containing protein [Nitrospirae bacterium YQR-1]